MGLGASVPRGVSRLRFPSYTPDTADGLSCKQQCDSQLRPCIEGECTNMGAGTQCSDRMGLPAQTCRNRQFECYQSCEQFHGGEVKEDSRGH